CANALTRSSTSLAVRCWHALIARNGIDYTLGSSTHGRWERLGGEWRHSKGYESRGLMSFSLSSPHSESNMKNAPRNNPTKDVTSSGKHTRRGSVVREAILSSQLHTGPKQDHVLESIKSLATKNSSVIGTSKPLVTKKDKEIPLRAAKGDDDIMSQERAC
ncbi:MAG TPA: hypothetical protein VHL14_11775, partial [Steroidobacteraceae bacterium]|nr:hypothetical protein [Steroidobacteraceae bacterium]